tara:strand:- start:224 stop:865 length:642 start_codon:yes stop_codon:yes gene_type:complete
MWFDVIKKPYVIGAEILNPKEIDYSPEPTRWKFNKLFQGSQGKTSNLPEDRRYEDSTLHWTPRLNEALCYAVFGSFVVPSAKSSYKDEDKPIIKQALKTDQDFQLRMDEDYADYKQGDRDNWMFINNKKNITPRGIEVPVDYDYRMPNTPKYKYLPDSKVSEVGKKLLQRMESGSLTSKDKENLLNSAGIIEKEMEGAIKHLKMMLSKYFGGQ